MPLPLALAFQVASGATAAAGLVTTSSPGSSSAGWAEPEYRSGPTGAMSAVLIVLRRAATGWKGCGWRDGWRDPAAGRVQPGANRQLHPSAVIAGFTSGIAIVIFVGQIDNLLGVDTEAAENSLLKLLHYMQGGFTRTGSR
ncbi:MAG: SulP family inorganic anion transporter [Anaerolineae bacterium]